MDKKTYINQFSKLVRWRLPSEEAEDVIADYEELLSAHPEDGAALVKTLGDPVLAAKLLGAAREYLCWMAVFSLLSLNMLFFVFNLFNCWMDYHKYQTYLFYFSIGLIAFWRWKNPKKKEEKCPGLWPAMLGAAGDCGSIGSGCGISFH